MGFPVHIYMCICIWLTNKFQVASIQVSLQTMIFTMSEKKIERASTVR